MMPTMLLYANPGVEFCEFLYLYSNAHLYK